MQYNLNPINSNIYSGGNVELNSNPYTRYAIEVKARNRARDDAFAKSFQDLSARTTPAGMDGVDLDNFMKRKAEWQDYVVKNEKAYKNPNLDNGQVYGEAMRRYNNVLNVAQQSKDKLAALKPLYQAYADPNKRKLISEQTIMDAHNATLPVNDPNFKRFPITSLKYDEPQFDAKQLQSFSTGLKSIIAPALKNKIPGATIIDASKNEKRIPYSIKLSDNDLNNIRAYASQWSGMSAPFANYLDEELHNPSDYHALNDVYKDHYGKDANIGSREDMATALALSNISADLSGVDVKPYTNTLGNQMTMEAIRQRNRIALKGIPSASSEGGSGKSTWVQDMVDAANSGDKEQIKNTAAQLLAANPNYLRLKGQPFVDKNGFLRVEYQANEFDPNAGKKDASGKPVGDYVWKDKAHSIKLSDINDPKVKAELAAFQQKFLGTNQKVKNDPYYNKPINASKTYKYNGKSFSTEQLTKAAEQSGMSLSDYLKQLGIK